MLASLDYDRHRPAFSGELARWVQDQLPDGRSELVVDVGCGTGRSTRWARSFADRVVGVDASEHMIELAEQINDDSHVSFRHAAAESFAHVVEPASVVLSGSAFEWFDKQAFRAELAKVLEIRGQFLIIWSWIETLDDVSRGWFGLLRRLLGAQVGPDPNDAMAMGMTFFHLPPRWIVTRPSVRYTGADLAGFVRSSSYWADERGDNEDRLEGAIAAFLAEHGASDGTVGIQFREVAMIGQP